MVECRTPEWEIGGWKPTAAVLCPWARHFTPRKYWLISQEAVVPSRHDWKIVDWDVKPQHKQTNNSDKDLQLWCGNYVMSKKLEEDLSYCLDPDPEHPFLDPECSVKVGIPVMRYERAARPCALNFRLAALKCRFGRPSNALSSVGVWPSTPPLCASFIQNVITLTGHLFIGKNVAYPNTVTCLLISNCSGKQTD